MSCIVGSDRRKGHEFTVCTDHQLPFTIDVNNSSGSRGP